MKKISFILSLIMIAIPVFLNAQPDTVYVVGDTSVAGGNLNAAITTAMNAGSLSNKVFKLELNKRYILKDSILVPAGQCLTIVAPEPGTTQSTAPPQILCASGSETYNIPFNNMFECYGDLSLKNIWLLSANTHGEQAWTCIIFREATQSAARRCTFENVIIDYSSIPRDAGGSVTVACKNFRGTFKNCYWKNCVDRHFRYYGRALSFPYSSKGWYGDSLTFENCTFANIGYVLMQEEGEYYSYVKFNHCTFYNVVMFPMESGWWNKLTVTNCVFANTWMYGNISVMGETEGAIFKIDSLSKSYYDGVYSFPYTEQDRRILFANSAYCLDQWLVDWMGIGPNGSPYGQNRHRYDSDEEIPVPQPMLNQHTLIFFDSVDTGGKKVFPYMNKLNLYNGVSITPTCSVTSGPGYTYPDVQTLEEYNPRFVNPPINLDSLKIFLYDKWDNSQDMPWAWEPWNSFNQVWPLKENLSYANNTLKTAGLGGLPLGDLCRWWPEKYQQWKAQEQTENANISYWLNTGIHYQDLNYVTAKSLLPKADSLMNMLAENAVLARIEGSTVDSYGKSSCWKFEYFWFDTSDFHNSKRYYLVGQNYQVTFDRVEPLGVGPFRIINRWMDSDSALYLAEAAGGANIRKQYPSCTVTTTLFQWPAPPFTTEWRIVYSYNNRTTTFSIDASAAQVVSVKGKDDVVPTKFTLHQNYPNPFNPMTVISYQLPVNSFVTLKVYNLLGQVVATLFEGIRQPGNYETPFDGSKLTSGVYIYSLRASKFVETKKMIIIK